MACSGCCEQPDTVTQLKAGPGAAAGPGAHSARCGGDSPSARGPAGNYGKDQLCLEITELFMRGWVPACFCQWQQQPGERNVYFSCRVVREERSPGFLGRGLHVYSKRKSKCPTPSIATRGLRQSTGAPVLAESRVRARRHGDGGGSLFNSPS